MEVALSCFRIQAPVCRNGICLCYGACCRKSQKIKVGQSLLVPFHFHPSLLAALLAALVCASRCGPFVLKAARSLTCYHTAICRRLLSCQCQLLSWCSPPAHLWRQHQQQCMPPSFLHSLPPFPLPPPQKPRAISTCKVQRNCGRLLEQPQ